MNPALLGGTLRNVLLFANPISGRGRAKMLATLIRRRLRREGYRVDVHFEPPDQIEPGRLDPTSHAAVVIGGDGTLRAVANRLLALPNLPPLIPVPMGTANLMARQLRMPRLHTLSAAAWVSSSLDGGNVVKYDVARANNEICLLMAGIGFDGQVVHDLAKNRAGPIRYASYLLPTAKALGFYPFHALRVVADGTEVFASRPAIAFVGNSPEYGTGFPVLPQADPRDGWLDLCVLPCGSRTELLQWCMAIVTGTHLSAKGVVSLRARHLRIESSEPVPVQMDGDAAGFTPLSIDLLPAQLSFMVASE
jgi:diacylglycerol kinase (ATP)